MVDVSVLIAARNEEFLNQTIENVLEAKQPTTEVIVVLDGYFPTDYKMYHDVKYIYNAVSIGQRAAINQAAKLSTAKFIMKLDAHCKVAPHFDRVLMEHCRPENTLIPRMYNLHAFDWVCDTCGARIYQSAEPGPHNCTEPMSGWHKEIVWKEKTNPTTDAMMFDSDMKFGYWRDFKNRPEGKGTLVPSLGALGACFFMWRKRFFDLGGLDEGHGGWGQFGTEMSCKSWLSGGQQLICTKTWFSHMFRTGNGFGFPYPISGRQTSHARKYSQDLWLNDKWEGQIYPLRWLIERFAPVPTWDEAAMKRIQNTRFKTSQYVGNLIQVPASLDQNTQKITVKRSTKAGIVYYTANEIDENLAKICRDNLKRAAGSREIVSVSRHSIDFDNNLVLPEKRSVLTMFKQILLGLENLGADVVFFAEDDVLYHPSHFDFDPPDSVEFWYNQNNWKVNAKDGQALFYYCKQTLGVCAKTKDAIEHYRKRVQRVEAEGFRIRMGYEPGTHRFPRGFDQTKSDVYFSKFPNVDIRHGGNLSGVRFSKDQYRNKNSIIGWTLADEIPFWGKTKGRYSEWLNEISSKNFDSDSGS